VACVINLCHISYAINLRRISRRRANGMNEAQVDDLSTREIGPAKIVWVEAPKEMERITKIARSKMHGTTVSDMPSTEAWFPLDDAHW
jgi:hypothetical protein